MDRDKLQVYPAFLLLYYYKLQPMVSKLSEASSKKALSGCRISRPSWPAGAALRAREPVRKSFCMSITRKAEPYAIIK